MGEINQVSGNVHNKKIGKAGEDIAERYLKKNGYSVREKNFRSHFGEIDIVAEEAGTIVFVEVKTRTSDAYGDGTESITISKIRTITRTAQLYLSAYKCTNRDCRFDVIAIQLVRGEVSELSHIKNAF
ncbi:MAG: YraN family protein [Candidatus Ancaeobacter aquaticus]|nr:YraN family protein [Candidatus Ancaeobacter aquaticus]